jgi:hypothetical protein
MKSIKNIAGVMLLALFFCSCGQHYSNDISGRQLAEDGALLPINDSLVALDSAGYIHFTATDGNPLVQDSVYIIQKTWWQAWEQGKKDGSVLIFCIAIILAAFFLGILIWRLQTQRDSSSRAPLGWLVPVFAAAIVAGFALEWDKWNSEREIIKKDYVEYIQKDGDLRNYWPTPVKHY